MYFQNSVNGQFDLSIETFETMYFYFWCLQTLTKKKEPYSWGKIKFTHFKWTKDHNFPEFLFLSVSGVGLHSSFFFFFTYLFTCHVGYECLWLFCTSSDYLFSHRIILPREWSGSSAPKRNESSCKIICVSRIHEPKITANIWGIYLRFSQWLQQYKKHQHTLWLSKCILIMSIKFLAYFMCGETYFLLMCHKFMRIFHSFIHSFIWCSYQDFLRKKWFPFFFHRSHRMWLCFSSLLVLTLIIWSITAKNNTKRYISIIFHSWVRLS